MRKKLIKIDFCNEQDDGELTPSLRAYMKSAFTAAVKRFGIPYTAVVSVNLVDENAIREYNRENRNTDRVTDVLSFPLQSFKEGEADFDAVSDGEFDEAGYLMLGDVVICMSVAKKQAEEYGHTPLREFAFLVTHSMLHLLGYDHMEPEEEKVMFARQEEILKELGITR